MGNIATHYLFQKRLGIRRCLAGFCCITCQYYNQAFENQHRRKRDISSYLLDSFIIVDTASMVAMTCGRYKAFNSQNTSHSSLVTFIAHILELYNSFYDYFVEKQPSYKGFVWRRSYTPFMLSIWYGLLIYINMLCNHYSLFVHMIFHSHRQTQRGLYGE